MQEKAATVAVGAATEGVLQGNPFMLSLLSLLVGAGIALAMWWVMNKRGASKRSEGGNGGGRTAQYQSSVDAKLAKLITQGEVHSQQNQQIIEAMRENNRELTDLRVEIAKAVARA